GAGNLPAYSTSPFARAPTRWRLPAPRSLQLPPPAPGERRRPPARLQPRTPRATPAARAGPQQRRLVQTAEGAKTAYGLGGRRLIQTSVEKTGSKGGSED